MHYKIGNVIVKTEYAAKSVLQPNQTILKKILSLNKNTTLLDYGCGKLRYTIPLSSKIKSIVAVDSAEQLERIQKIGQVNTQLCNYVKENLKNVKVYSLNAKTWQNKKYDYILCINVLPVIPIVKLRKQIINMLTNLLKKNGILLITCQYNNSYFDNYQNYENSKKHHDGWLLANPGLSSYYAIIGPPKLTEYVKLLDTKKYKIYSIKDTAYLEITN